MGVTLKRKRAIGIWVPPGTFRAIGAAAKREGISKSAWLARAAEEKLSADMPRKPEEDA